MRYAIIDKGVVVNIIESDKAIYRSNVVDAADALIGSTWNGINFVPPLQQDQQQKG